MPDLHDCAYTNTPNALKLSYNHGDSTRTPLLFGSGAIRKDRSHATLCYWRKFVTDQTVEYKLRLIFHNEICFCFVLV